LSLCLKCDLCIIANDGIAHMKETIIPGKHIKNDIITN